MKDTFVTARLVSPDTIRLMIFSSAPSEHLHVFLMKDHQSSFRLEASRQNSMSGIFLADYRFPKPLDLGHSYRLLIDSYGEVPLDVSEATTFPGFDEKYAYKGPLGADASENGTQFALWAPLASEVNLKLKKKGEKTFSIHPLKRGEKGEYSISFEENLDGAEYLYQIVNNEALRETTDPYAKGSTLNGASSVVIDFKKIAVPMKEENLPKMESPTDAILYEGHIRDLTIDRHTDIVHKGRFLGLAEKGRKSQGGNPAGLDYLKYLGITHLQLLPIFDYQTVDEAHPDSSYNWGYDPRQYFVPEGSYASNLKDPYSRIKDLKKMVSTLHEEGIRVVMDVVYNHVYESSLSVFEAVVPNYYFRRRYSGKLATTSGCGNDLASERFMARRLILDSCRHWIEEYGIDGFRFDLMGIIDAQTLLEIEKMAKKKKPDFLLYGEGWNMGGELKIPQGRMENAFQLPGFAFFNDTFRETAKSFFAGDDGAKQAFKSCYAGLCVDFTLPKIFLDATQSINYVECHDNATYFDTIRKWCPRMRVEEILDRCKMAMAGVLFSHGIPFLHAGQEIAQSKWGEENTYNKGDHFNKFSYCLLDQRFEMATYLKNLIEIRKKMKAMRLSDPKTIDEGIDILEMDRILYINFLNKKAISPLKEFMEVYNPSDDDILFPLPSSGYGVSLEDLKKRKGSSSDPSSVLIPKRSVMLLMAK